jgi:hypothetical protein
MRNEYIERQMGENGKKQTFQFRNAILMELWEYELRGQISDGLWENTANTGWVYWCSVKPMIGPETRLLQPVGYRIKTNFQFTRLIKYIGDRMLDIVRKYEPNATEKDLRKYLNEIKNAMKAAGGK